MSVSLFRWLAILLVFIAILPAGAHLLEVPNKLKLAQADYFTVQQIYAGWALFGIVLFAAIASTLGYVIALQQSGRPFLYPLLALMLVLLNLGLFFLFTFPANRATSNWTLVPPDWETLRTQWEYSHAVNALVIFAAFFCLLISALREQPQG
jgi:hypothetical protein